MDHRIKDLIKEKGYTQQEFADKLEMTRVGLSQLINGKPSYPTLEKIATALDVPMWQLFASKEEVQGEDLIALIEHKGNFYKATTIDELKEVIFQISDKNDSERKEWILRIMRNIFINNYNSIIKKVSQEILDDNVDSDFSSLNEVAKSIDSLNEELKIPFTMFLSGYKYNEIAEKLDLPVGTVKSRIYFARQEIQKLLYKQV